MHVGDGAGEAITGSRREPSQSQGQLIEADRGQHRPGNPPHDPNGCPERPECRDNEPNNPREMNPPIQKCEDGEESSSPDKELGQSVDEELPVTQQPKLFWSTRWLMSGLALA